MRRILAIAGSLTVTSVAMLAMSSSAPATGSCASCRPWWHLTSSVRPAVLSTGGEGTIVVQAANIGNAPTSGAITLSATLPAGLSVVTKGATPKILFWPSLKTGTTSEFNSTILAEEICKVSGATITCTTNPLVKNNISDLGHVAPFETLELWVKVKDTGAIPGSEYHAEISGGEASTVTRHQKIRIEDEAAPPFGVEEYNLVPEEAGGGIDNRAGSHPYQLTATVALNQTSDPKAPPALARNFAFKLPPGQVGSATAVPKCSTAAFDTRVIGKINLCPGDTAIGAAIITFDEPYNLGVKTQPTPLYNLETAYGEPARFGFVIDGTPVILDTSVRSGRGEDYGVTVKVSNTTEAVNFITSTVVFWGAPGDSSHDESRGWACIRDGALRNSEFSTVASCVPSVEQSPPAFLTLPADCEEPFATSVSGVSWPNKTDSSGVSFGPFSYSLQDEANALAPLTACNQVPFSPKISTEASTEDVAAPTGLDFNMDFHDEGLTSAHGLAQSQLKNTVVTLPDGFTIDPSAGVGLEGCRPADYARETVESIPGEGCPNQSKLGTVEIETPLLAQKIHGALYIAQPYENPFPEPEAGHPGGTLVALYIVAKNPETGILIKLAGKVVPNPVTGQLTTIFENTPQLPFSHFNFHFREGAQAPLISPPVCGTFTTQAQLTPWSAPLTASTESSSFTITKGFQGGACPTGGVPPFDPGIVSGAVNNNAGAFSPFYLHLTRTDAEQEIAGFSTNLPAGLTGNLSGIPFCPEAAIEAARQKTGAQEDAEPSCPPASQVGHTLVGTGVGAVLAYVPGKIYLAGPFHGAPFSLVSVTSALVGPFDLGTVVLRFGLAIDPYTAQVSVTPTGSEPIPTILRGIVTHVRDIRVYIDRDKFTLNPTSCNPLKIGSTLTSDLGASKTVTSPFQASNCQALGFKPIFKVWTSGRTSRTKGASLTVKLSYPAGVQANISKVKVDLPKQLPSRLTTLQKACTAGQFNANPAGCPVASRVGFAKAVTPLIPVPLEGPAYFVSHGGEQFPDLIMVLQGYGVTIDLVGSTFISKAGITSSTFKTVPDQPVGSFELTLPQGPFSALAANGNLCKAKLTMPTAFDAQNGARVRQNTKITATGCPKQKKAKGKKATKHHGKKRK